MIAKYSLIYFIFSCLIVFICLFYSAKPTLALELQNNKIGIHLATPQDEDLDRARDLVNSNGGDWGYVTIVIQDTDRDVNRWQEIFNKLRERHLIPIVRVATHPQGDNWSRPNKSDIDNWVNFFNKLNWVIENRYIILFNEPNHATEWGGAVSVKQYADISEYFARKLKAANPHYFIMLAGLDTSAPSQLPRYEDAGRFIENIISEIGVDDFNYLFDGWSSHSYPNPGFVGSADGVGQGSVRGYRWELSLLKSLRIKELPVFITETGWDGTQLGREESSNRMRDAFLHIWLSDQLVKAVTPFILNYQSEPFLKFSWVKPGNIGVFPEYEKIRDLPKIKGNPVQLEKGDITFDLPREVVVNSTYHFQITLKNQGQAIWSKESGYRVILDDIADSRYTISTLGLVKPGQTHTLDIYLNTELNIGKRTVRFILEKDEKPAIQSRAWELTIVPLPSLNFKISLVPKVRTRGNDFELQIFDEYDQLVYRLRDLEVDRGQGRVDQVENIALGRKYRIVLLKPGYLPRQKIIIFSKDTNDITFENMLPFDFNGDGTASWEDLQTLFSHPGKFNIMLP